MSACLRVLGLFCWPGIDFCFLRFDHQRVFVKPVVIVLTPLVQKRLPQAHAVISIFVSLLVALIDSCAKQAAACQSVQPNLCSS